MKYIYALLLIVFFILPSCSSKSTVIEKSVAVELDTIKEQLKKGTAIVVDVRTSEEFEAGHIPHSINIPLEIIGESNKQLKAYDKVIVVCRSGKRSAKSKLILEQNGFMNIYDGGGWQNFQEKLP